MNSLLHKQISIPIKIANPDNKRILKIKDMIFSFDHSIKVIPVGGNANDT